MREPAGAAAETPAITSSGESALDKLAASALARVLSGVRSCRYGFLRSVNYLILLLHRWDKECGRRLYQRMCYIHASLAERALLHNLPLARRVGANQHEPIGPDL